MKRKSKNKGEIVFLLFSIVFLAVDIVEAYLRLSIYLIWLFIGLYLVFTTISLFRFQNRPFGMFLYVLAEMLIIVASFNPFVLSVFIMAAIVALVFQALAVRGKFDFH